MDYNAGNSTPADPAIQSDIPSPLQVDATRMAQIYRDRDKQQAMTWRPFAGTLGAAVNSDTFPNQSIILDSLPDWWRIKIWALAGSSANTATIQFGVGQGEVLTIGPTSGVLDFIIPGAYTRKILITNNSPVQSIAYLVSAIEGFDPLRVG